MKYYILSLCLGILYSSAYCQTFSGTVYYDAQEPAVGAIIQALEKDSSTVITYTVSSVNGSWEINLEDRTSPFLIKISLFGFENEWIPINSVKDGRSNLNRELQPKSINLEEISVKDEAFGVKRSGDTLSFRLETYTTGAERTLGDVIKRLPGMEIQDGSVYYGGQKITHMFVQGKDIINANHQLATDGIRADMLKEIKIIENFKEASQQFQRERSDDVAMDVKLKDDALSKWSGEAELLGGYPSSVKANLSAFNLSDNIGLSGFARGNNVGERILTFRDMLNMLSSRGGRRFHVRSEEFVNLVPEELNMNDEVQSNTDGILNLNVDWKVKENLKIKGFLMGAYAQRASNVFLSTNYLAEEKVREEVIDRETRTPIGNTMWRVEWQLDSSTFIEGAIPFTINTRSNEENRRGTFDDLPFQTRNDQESWTYSLSPFVKLRKQIGNNLLEIDARYQDAKQNADLAFEDIFPFLGIPLDEVDSLYSILQNKQIESTEFNLSSSYKIIKGQWFLKPGLEYAYQHQTALHLAETPGVKDFDRDDEMKQNTSIVSVSGGIENDKWEVFPTLRYNYLQRDFLQSTEHNEGFFTYAFRTVRKFNRAHSLTLDASYGFQFPNFNESRNVNEINSATQINTGLYPVDLATKGWNASLNYHNFIVTRKTFIFARLEYNYNTDVVSNFTESFGNYILSGFIPTPSSQALNWRSFVGYELPFAPIRVAPRINIRWSEGFSTNRGAELESTNLFQSYDLGFESRWEFPLNVEIGVTYNNNVVEVEGNPNNRFESWEPRIELAYQVGKLNLESKFVYDQAGSGNLSSDLYLLDFEANYELKKLPLTLKLQANNILNLNGRERVRNDFNINISRLRRYEIFPGFIIAGVIWQF